MANDLGNYYGGANVKITDKLDNMISPIGTAGIPSLRAKTGGAQTAGKPVSGAAQAATDPNKKTGRENPMEYDLKRGYPILESTNYGTQPTVTTDTLSAVPAATELSPEDEAAALERRTFGIPTTNTDLNWTNVNTPSRGAQAPFNGRDMDSALGQLQAAYNQNMGTYTPKTEEEIQRQAAADYQSYYDQLRTAAGNEYQMNDLALLQQIAGLQRGYDKSRDASRQEYASAYSQADRNLLSRGMQRSSYGAQTLSNVALKGAEAQQAIWDAQLEQEANLEAQRRQLAGNYAATLQGYAAGQASDVMSRVWDLRDTEYERNVTRANTLNQLATQLYGYLNQINEQEREQYNTNRTMAESQHQFDVGVAQSRQALEDTRTQYAANLAEEMRQYNNSANMQELAFRAQYPQMGFTRGEDGRFVLDQDQNSRRLMDQRYAELEAAYQELLNRPINVTVQSGGGVDYGQWVASQKSAQLVADKNGKTVPQTDTSSSAYQALMSGLGLTAKTTQTGGTGAAAETVYRPNALK